MPLATKGREIPIKKAQTRAVAVTTSAAAAKPALEKKSGRLSAAPVDMTLPVPEQKQLADNWCWAACCAMLVKFFYDKEVRQCRMANQLFGQTVCCSSLTPSTETACDQGCQLDDVAKIYSKFGVQVTLQKRPVSFATVQAEIEAGRPVLVGFMFEGGGSHVVMIRGCFEVGGERFLKVNDPKDGSVSLRSLTDVRTANQRGAWKFSWIGIQKTDHNGGGK